MGGEGLGAWRFRGVLIRLGLTAVVATTSFRYHPNTLQVKSIRLCEPRWVLKNR